METSEGINASESDALSIQRAEEFSRSDPPRTIACASSDDVVFHVDRVMLQGTSGFFRDMLSLPQTDATPRSTTDAPIKMNESASVLNPFFLLVHGKAPRPRIDSLSHFLDVALTARKYDAGLVLLALRSDLRTLAHKDPLKAYAFAGRFDWEDVAVYISTLTRYHFVCDMDPADVEHIPAPFYHRLATMHISRLRPPAPSRSLDGWE